MEKISEFFKQVGERLSNPFLISFLFSWTVINWKVVVALIFYSPFDLKNDGYKSYNELISKEVTTYSGIVYPLLGALAYTLFYPIVRATLHVFNGWIKSKGDDMYYKATRESTISTAKYLKLREQSMQLMEQLSSVTKDESVFLSEKMTLHANLEDYKSQLNQLKIELNNAQNDPVKNKFENLKSVINKSLIDGEWKVLYKQLNNVNDIVTELSIKNGRGVFTTSLPSYSREFEISYLFSGGTNFLIVFKAIASLRLTPHYLAGGSDLSPSGMFSLIIQKNKGALIGVDYFSNKVILENDQLVQNLINSAPQRYSVVTSFPDAENVKKVVMPHRASNNQLNPYQFVINNLKK